MQSLGLKLIPFENFLIKMYCRDLNDIVLNIIGNFNYSKYIWYQEVLYIINNHPRSIGTLIEFEMDLLVREDFDHAKT